MPGPLPLNRPFAMPMFNDFVPRKIQPWIYLVFAFMFQMSGGMYAGTLPQVMGDTCLMREDVLMVILCGVVGVNMPFPFLFRFKFRFTNRQLLIVAASVIAVCNYLCTLTQSLPVLCVLSYLCGFFKLCGTFECMSNIQLWMTPERDFTIFFPLLYCFVLGNMSLSPWVATKLTYWLQSWHAVHYLMCGTMLVIVLLVLLLTHDYRFMKPLPLVSLDWLGCLLWSALMLEVIFLFNYGEFYNWWDGQTWRTVLLMVPVTLCFAIQRMLHIRHPFIAKEAWKIKKLLPLLFLFVVMELISATPKVMQNAFVGRVLQYGATTTAVLNIMEWLGTICGCLFVLLWCHTWKKKFTTLLTIGCATLVGYEVLMYFLIFPGLNIEMLYLPSFVRTFGIAIFFTALTICLEEMMDFKYFFMGLTMTGLVRNGVAETIFSGIYSRHLRYSICDNLARGLPYDAVQALMISVKHLFGSACLAGMAVLFVFLLWNVQPVRSTLLKIPYWNFVGKKVKEEMKAEEEMA